MFERLLDLLLHAKSGVLAGVFVVGTTGALVSATMQNGVATITVTQASPSPAASASPTASPNTTVSNTTTTQNSSLVLSSSQALNQAGTSGAEPCDDEAHERNAAVKDVNTAFSALHNDLAHHRKDARTEEQRDLLKDADKELMAIRQAAVKAIHATFDCAKHDDDEDEDADADEDNDDEDDDNSSGNVHADVTFTGTDPDAIADEAIAMMTKVHDDVLAKLSTVNPQTQQTQNARPGRTPKPESKSKSRSSEHDRDSHGDRD